jgi:hypothetical protein
MGNRSTLAQLMNSAYICHQVMRYFFLFAILFVCQAGLSQIAVGAVDGMYVNWCAGSVSLTSGEKIICQIRFDQLNQNMDVRYNNQILEIPSADIAAFEFYDSVKQERRVFEKIQVPSGKLVMMEYLFQNKRAAILQERFIRNFHMVYVSVNLEPRKFRYTAPIEKKFLLHKGTRLALTVSPQNLVTILQDKKREVNAFIKQNKIRFDDVDDYITVLNYYETL